MLDGALGFTDLSTIEVLARGYEMNKVAQDIPRFDMVEEVRSASTHGVTRKRKAGEDAAADEPEAAWRVTASVMVGRDTERGHTSFLTFARRGLRVNDHHHAPATETAGAPPGEGGAAAQSEGEPQSK
mmetsp:Transcript_38082/g.89991  ORF Transcript_38082/g.89991 Transcript_38082/m.89991 type:complete len:128 (+) Transcript_38082:732-1115(+)